MQKNREVVALLAVWTILFATIGAVQANNYGSDGIDPALLDDAHMESGLAPPFRIQQATPKRWHGLYAAHLTPVVSPGPLETEAGYTRFDHIIRKVARKYQVDFYVIKAIIKAESQFDPFAVSSRGACGLMQLMPSTAHSLGVEKIFDPKENITAGVKYYKQLLDLFDGNRQLAIAAYNAGVAMVKKYGGVPPFPVTKTYLSKVLNYVEEFRTS